MEILLTGVRPAIFWRRFPGHTAIPFPCASQCEPMWGIMHHTFQLGVAKQNTTAQLHQVASLLTTLDHTKSVNYLLFSLRHAKMCRTPFARSKIEYPLSHPC